MADPNPYDSIVSAASGPKPSSYDDIIERHATANGLDSNLVRAVMGQESSGNRVAVSSKGARGLMQLMPATAKRFGVAKPNDPEQNIAGGTKYLKYLSDRYDGDIDKTLAAYNAGEGNVDKYGGIPPFKETQNYVPSVKARYAKLSGQSPTQKSPANPYDSIVQAATAADTQTPAIKAAEADVASKQQSQTKIAAQVQTATPNPYDSIVAAATPQATGRGAGMARAGQVAVTRGAQRTPTVDWSNPSSVKAYVENLAGPKVQRAVARQQIAGAQQQAATQRAIDQAEGRAINDPGAFRPRPDSQIVIRGPQNPYSFRNQDEPELRRRVRAQVYSEGAEGIRDRPIAQGPVPSPADVESEVDARMKEIGSASARATTQTQQGPSMQAAPESTVTDRLKQILGTVNPAIGFTQGLNLNQRDQGRLSDIINKYAPGIAALDTPYGLKTDFPRGVVHGATLGAVGQPKPTDSEEQILPGLTRFGAGETAGALVPLALTEGALPEGLSPAMRTGATFGATGTGRQAVNALEGRPVDLKAPLVDAALGLVMGRLAGQNPSMLRRAAAFVAPGLVVDISQGATKEQAAQRALTNLGFAISGGGKAEQPEASLTEPVKASIAPVIADARAERVRDTIPSDTQPIDMSAPKLARTALGTALAQRGENEAQVKTQPNITAQPESIQSAEKQNAGIGNPQPSSEQVLRLATIGTNQPRGIPETGQTDVVGAESVRHVDLQSRRTRNTESGNKGQFKPETPAQAEARRQQVAQSASDRRGQPVSPAMIDSVVSIANAMDRGVSLRAEPDGQVIKNLRLDRGQPQAQFDRDWVDLTDAQFHRIAAQARGEKEGANVFAFPSKESSVSTPQPDLSTQAQPAIPDTVNVTPQGAASVASMPETVSADEIATERTARLEAQQRARQRAVDRGEDIAPYDQHIANIKAGGIDEEIRDRIAARKEREASEAKLPNGYPAIHDGQLSGIGTKVPEGWKFKFQSRANPNIVAVSDPAKPNEYLHVDVTALTPEQRASLEIPTTISVPSGAASEVGKTIKIAGKLELAERRLADLERGNAPPQMLNSWRDHVSRLKATEPTAPPVPEGKAVAPSPPETLAQRPLRGDELPETESNRQTGSQKPEASARATAPIIPSEGKASEPVIKPDLSAKERSFPQTLASSQRESGTDLTYEPITNPEARASAKSTVDTKGVDDAMDDLRASGGAHRTALGIELIDRATSAAKTAEDAGDKAEAAVRYGQAAEAASLASANLTTAGQEVQAAQIANRYTPEGALREGARIAHSRNIPFRAEEAKATSDIAQTISDSNVRIKELEKTVADLRAGRQPTTPKPTRIDTVKDYFSRLETDAKARLEARKSVSVSGPQTGASAIPLDLADWTIIGAAKIAKGGLNYAQWQAEMVRDLGVQVKPYLQRIFQDAHSQVKDRRTAISEEMKNRAAERRQQPGQTLQDALEDLNSERAKNRQARRDLDRHFHQLERAEQRKNLDAFLSLTRDSLLSVRGLLRILGGMGGKQAIDFGSRFVKAGLDITESKVLGTPRTSAAPSFGSVLRTIGGFRERIGPATKGAFTGKGSEIMPEAYPTPPSESPYVTYAVRIMQKLYGTKEAVIRSWAYPDTYQSTARTFALNDLADGLIKRSSVDERARDYARGRTEFEGARNKQLAKSLAEQTAQYEIDSKQVIPSMRNVRVKDMVESPTELLHSLSLQAADKAVYAQPNRLATKARGIFPDTAGGKIAQNIVLPFAKRPASNIADNLFGYTGLRVIPEGGRVVRDVINRQFNPSQVKAFNDAVGKGAAGFAVMAAGAILNKRGVLTSPLDKEHPASVKIGEKYYQVGNVPVVGWLLGMGAAYQNDGAKAVPISMAKMILEHPLLRSAKDISEGLSNIAHAKASGSGWVQSAESGAEKYAGQTAARAVPAPVKIAAEASDTKERDTSGLTGPIRAALPGVRQTLPETGEKPRSSVVNPLYSRSTYKQDARDLKAELITKARSGQDVSKDFKSGIDQGLLRPSDENAIQRASELTPLQQTFQHKSILKALEAYADLTASQREEVRTMLEDKTSASRIDGLNLKEQAEARSRMKALGLRERRPGEIVPILPQQMKPVRKTPQPIRPSL